LQKHSTTETHLRSIFILTDAINTDTKIKKRLLKMRKQIQQGTSFAQLAKKYSANSLAASKGGDAGWITPGQLTPPSLERAMNQLQAKQLSQPIKADNGWYLLQVLARRKKDDTQVYRRRQVQQLLYKRKFEEEMQTWLRQLRSMSYIDIKAA